MQFESLNIIEPILRSLKEEGYTIPTPIQSKAIPVILSGRDLIGCAQTGTGKTAAFAIPVLQHLYNKEMNGERRIIKSLIITPTRELALQIEESFNAYGRHTGLRCTSVYGGVSQHAQVNMLRKGIDILVATPGRLLDLIDQRHLSISKIEIFILDEADRMLDMGFIHDIRKIVRMLPEKRQSLFFSATIPREIISLAGSIVNDPVKVEVSPPASTVELVDQYVYFTGKKDKNALLIDLLQDEKMKTVLVFTRTKYGADKVVNVLRKKNITAEAIHSNKAQANRQRALTNFKERKTRVLVATDIAARGIDVDDLGYVINYEIPNISETYVHRIGRTGRAGLGGTAISFCDIDEKIYLRDIEKLIAKKLQVVSDHPYALAEIVPFIPQVPRVRPGNARKLFYSRSGRR
ncbi:MAG: DEAD/DEAH box helicase [Bacteroidales bacterium]|jgi:ATP-dependent RNA helicase RhlE